MEEAHQTPKTAIGEVASTSCERCRRRKIKCDRRQPCSRCQKAKTECILRGSGEKQRPVPKSYVQALEGQVASLQLFIHKIAMADDKQREGMLAAFKSTQNAPGGSSSAQPIEPPLAVNETELGLARARSGQLRKLKTGNAVQFYGGTSLFQFHIPEKISVPSYSMNSALFEPQNNLTVQEQSLEIEGLSPRDEFFQHAPHDGISQALMATFFREQYPYNMCIYREYFLRDYDTGIGRYYSDLLMYALCAMGALAYDNPSRLSLSETFSQQAQILLYSSLESPDLTTLQALILLGQREIGHGKASKGWLFCGMAFRLAHEMGLHLDPNNWNGAMESPVDMEILRRIYWAAFITDKQLSLYFGRPPALYPHESDVRNTIRLPYPQDWQGLLDTYIAKGISTTAFEDGIALVGSFIYQAELSKILHSMITDLFENRRRSSVECATVVTTAHQIHVSLTKWLANLPGRLHWNQWTVGQVPACVLHLHMLFHTAMIILHRPPHHLLQKVGLSSSEDVEICYESLQAILKLMRTYARYYNYRSLPLDFVHTLSTTAGIVLMKRFFENLPIDDPEVSRSLALILSAMDEIKDTWPCIKEIHDSICQAMQTQNNSIPQTNLTMEIDFMSTLFVNREIATETGVSDSDIGPLITDDFLEDQFGWNEIQF